MTMLIQPATKYRAFAPVLLIDRRAHIGGNAYDHYDPAGLLVHKYGPHIFHPNCQLG